MPDSPHTADIVELVARLTALTNELDTHGDKDDASAVRAAITALQGSAVLPAQDTGVPCGTGSRASHEASTEIEASPEASIPNADDRLAELLALNENWDSYQGRPIDRAVAERVRAFYPLADKLGLSPWICPLSDGGLQIERSGTDDYCVEFNRDGTATVTFEGLSDKDALAFASTFALIKSLDRAASGILTEGGDVEQAPGDSLSSPARKAGDAQNG